MQRIFLSCFASKAYQNNYPIDVVAHLYQEAVLLAKEIDEFSKKDKLLKKYLMVTYGLDSLETLIKKNLNEDIRKLL